MVGEKSVKSKIEQITQRTWQVPFFDYFDLTSKFSPPPLVGFDYQIDGFLDFNVEFDTAFSAVDSLADKRNNAIEDVTSLAGAGMSKVQK